MKMLEEWRQSWSQRARFRELAHDVKPIYARWDEGFAASADACLHPLWRDARPAFVDLIRDGLPRDFLEHPAVAQQFCRQGFGAPQRHELDYLTSRGPELRRLIARLVESPIGRPTLDCRELQLSANTLGMLYYFARIAERLPVERQRTIVEFGGGYGCLCRVALELLPQPTTYVIVDLPEMLALQYVFVRASSAERRVVPHFSPPVEIVANAVNLVPVSFADQLSVEPDLFVSTFALSETPRQVQERVARGRFFDSDAVYLVGQEVDASLWERLALDSPSALIDAARRDFAEVDIQPFHFASAWELFARHPRRG